MNIIRILILTFMSKVTQGFEEFSKIKHGYRNKYFNISFCSIPSIHVCLMSCMEIKESCASIDFSQSLKICRAVDRYTTLVEDKQFLTMQKVAVNGNFTEWSSWSTCTKTCGGGTQFRNRTCTNPPPSDSGKDCKGDSSEVRKCSTDHCPVNGQYTQWTPWVSCREGCEDWVQYRNRTCTNPAPNYGGEDCEGESSESRTCEIDLCPESNLAREGTVFQSTVYPENDGVNNYASLAIDGKFNLTGIAPFTHTVHKENHWLSIQLKRDAKIYGIHVINRYGDDVRPRLDPFDIIISTQPYYYGPTITVCKQGIPGNRMEIRITCDVNPMVGRSVKIQITGRREFLHVQEVEIYGFYI